MVDIARELTARFGVSVVRFDFWGEGESDGDFVDSSISSREVDLETVVEYVRASLRPRSVILIGIRSSVAYILDYARRNSDIDGFVAIDPVIDTAAFTAEILRKDLSQQLVIHRKVVTNRDELAARLRDGGTVCIEGYFLGRELFCDLTHTERIANRQLALSIPCLALSTQQTPRSKDWLALEGITTKLSRKHISVEPFWKARRYVGNEYVAVAAILYQEITELVGNHDSTR